MNKTQRIFLILILLLTFGIRIWNVGNLPTFISDEASIGYNAWSILKTGKDEWGKFLPLNFKAFGEYKLPFYIYLTVPFVAFFGLNEFSTRLPSVIFGSLTVLLAVFWIKRVVKNNWLFAFLTGFFLAILPWHIQTSRMTLEANLSLFLIILGLFFWEKGWKKNYFFYFSFLSFGLSLYTYNACRVFVPLLIGGLIFLYRREKKLKKLIAPGIILIFFVLFLITEGFRGTPERLQKVGIFTNPGILSQINEKRVSCLENNSEFICRLFYNRPVFYSLKFVGNWLSHYSLRFLFLKGAGLAQYEVPERGVAYLFELPLIILGIFWLFQKERNFFWLLFWWVLISPIANSFTGPAHPVRAIFLLMAIPVLTAGGVIFILEKIKVSKIKVGVLVGILVISFWSFGKFLIDYFVFYPQKHTSTWQAGYKPLYQRLTLWEKNYDKILITKFYGEPHIFYLFYRQIDPEQYQKGEGVIRYDRKDKWVNVDRIGKYWFFEKLDFNQVNGKELIVLAPKEINFELEVLDEIKYPQGNSAFIIGKVK